ncbi:hypothetical protein TREPR_1436 [Treponema primitia ZAS-2]|uniref:Uncharacterized protein n=1 Tax=Treponema primitia (strain ATCC BAA-887 / DSM 12427 / ZAS-2) TaxID=545694 RepID=F5YQ63_TREPZ|nr:hypothetical protein TREPR_1436 [Treponema primitia ZAS-2]
MGLVTQGEEECPAGSDIGGGGGKAKHARIGPSAVMYRVYLAKSGDNPLFVGIAYPDGNLTHEQLIPNRVPLNELVIFLV